MRNRLNRPVIAAIERHIANGLGDAEIGRIVGVSHEPVRKIRRGEHSRQKGIEKPTGFLGYVPTEEEIERQCFELRMQRDDPEPEHWSPPEIDMLALVQGTN